MLINRVQNFIVTYQDRIDKYLNQNSLFSRNEIKELINAQCVFVNETVAIRKPHFKVRVGDKIKVTAIIDKETKIIPEKMFIDVVYEDDDLLIINKPTNLVVHPAPGHPNGTLVNGLLYHFKHLSDCNGITRPGIVHRIDKDTSGLMVVAKNNLAHQFLASELKKHHITRVYYAIVKGVIPNKITHVNLPIGRDLFFRKKMCVTRANGKDAITHIHVVETQQDQTFVKCILETGRTHQIRVHLQYLKHPIIGDPVYGVAIDDFNQRLHAYSLTLKHPTTKKMMTFYASLPPEFKPFKIKDEML